MGKEIAVLVVEDSSYAADINMHYLKRGGYEPVYTVVADSQAMHRSLKERRWDIILSDHNMPGFSALEALDFRNRYAADVPFLIVTEWISDDELAEAFRKQASYYIPKEKLRHLAAAVGCLLKDDDD